MSSRKKHPALFLTVCVLSATLIPVGVLCYLKFTGPERDALATAQNATRKAVVNGLDAEFGSYELVERPADDEYSGGKAFHFKGTVSILNNMGARVTRVWECSVLPGKSVPNRLVVGEDLIVESKYEKAVSAAAINAIKSIPSYLGDIALTVANDNKLDALNPELDELLAMPDGRQKVKSLVAFSKKVKEMKFDKKKDRR